MMKVFRIKHKKKGYYAGKSGKYSKKYGKLYTKNNIKLAWVHMIKGLKDENQHSIERYELIKDATFNIGEL